ncbi:MAG: hypothetical protein LIO50_05240 [Phascolarctobacterium sp.]|uniref:type IV pilus modification PilV family protein n=1 Tax=Phascolarctobacterium sp. TaxID=2049039 RepID=UPI0025E6F203|nr:hypothetical protein [Phascolarctobacterium sp.]MCC8158607.1 hypothetical protein [Phascolarctobacterium sp.]
MKGIQQFRKNKQGFLLVDAMIGVLVVAIGLAALAALYTYGIGVMVSAARQEKAVQIASEKIELLKAADGHSEADIKLIAEHINSKENNKILLDNIEYSIRAAVGASLYDTNRNYPGDDTIYPVKVTITWSDPRPQVLTLQTYIHTNE